MKPQSSKLTTFVLLLITTLIAVSVACGDSSTPDEPAGTPSTTDGTDGKPSNETKPEDPVKNYKEANPTEYNELPLGISFLDNSENTYYKKADNASEFVAKLDFSLKKGDKLSVIAQPVNAAWAPRIELVKASPQPATLASATNPNPGGSIHIPWTQGESQEVSFNKGYNIPVAGHYTLMIKNLTPGVEHPEVLIKIKFQKTTEAGPSNPICPGDPECPKDPVCPGNPGCPTNEPICPGDPKCPSEGGNLENTPFKGLQNAAVINKFRDLNNGRHGNTNYGGARQYMFSQLDNHGGEVECVYTGRKLRTRGIPNGSNMNTEHTWPQSKGGDGTTKADLHHLFPTDSKANSRRSSHPFCERNSGTPKWEEGGSKLWGGCFEPRDVHKGNVARAMFYVAAMGSGLNSLGKEQQDVLRKWHKQDPVDQAERDREAGIFKEQGSHNYFVLHPELVDKVDDFDKYLN